MRALFPEKPLKPTDFRPRTTTEITRLEAFSDAVFAFAITLLVVSLEVPATFSELMHVMRGFLAFGICFTALMWIWFQHTRFFRRYGMQDAGTVALNGLLLFVVLFYVYPLKFLWTLLVGVSSGAHLQPQAAAEPIIRASDGFKLMLTYGLGFAAIFFTLALLYVLAYFRRAKLDLNELEIFDTKASIVENVAVGAVGLVSVTLAAMGLTFVAGICYFLIGPVKALHGYQYGSRRARLAARFTATPKSAAQPAD